MESSHAWVLGTLQAARYALPEANARVIAIDATETCLRHTVDLQWYDQLRRSESVAAGLIETSGN
jgi:hypothetical protein